MDDLLKDDDELELDDPLAPVKPIIPLDDELDPDIDSAESLAEEEDEEIDAFDDVEVDEM
ncbi:MAG: hypothetical protein ACYC1K_02805 [Minisyncoccota bacterium]